MGPPCSVGDKALEQLPGMAVTSAPVPVGAPITMAVHTQTSTPMSQSAILPRRYVEGGARPGCPWGRPYSGPCLTAEVAQCGHSARHMGPWAPHLACFPRAPVGLGALAFHPVVCPEEPCLPTCARAHICERGDQARRDAHTSSSAMTVPSH